MEKGKRPAYLPHPGLFSCPGSPEWPFQAVPAGGGTQHETRAGASWPGGSDNLSNDNRLAAGEPGEPIVGLDFGTFAVKGIWHHRGETRRVQMATSGSPLEAAWRCLQELSRGYNHGEVRLGLVGANADLLAEKLDVQPCLEIQALQGGLEEEGLAPDAVLALGHENMYYLELDRQGNISFFNRNGQCAAGSGSFWYQQATRMGFDDRGLAELAGQAESAVRISGRCAVFAKSDMTHAINEGATQAQVAAGMARALSDLVLTGVALNRLQPGMRLMVVGGVANNRAVMDWLRRGAGEKGVSTSVPGQHEFLAALGAAAQGERVSLADLNEACARKTEQFQPRHPLPALSPDRVHYLPETWPDPGHLDLSRVYLGVDCGSVSTKCALVDARGRFFGGVYLPTAGRPALQVLELMKKVEQEYGPLLEQVPIVATTTGSGRFLSQKILQAEYAVDEITCQAEGVKHLFPGQGDLAIIEIGGEDSKFLQLSQGVLADYSMNPVCAAGTGTFLENLASLLGVDVKEEFSRLAFSAPFAMDLGDTCTLLSQSVLVAAAARGLSREAQLASLGYASARNYLTATVDSRPLLGQLVFTGATAYNHALASALAAEAGRDLVVPPHPHLSGALGAALMARELEARGVAGSFSFRCLDHLQEFQVGQMRCQAQCQHDHRCTLDVITFQDGSRFLYGDRCGMYSGREQSPGNQELPDLAQMRQDFFWQAAGPSREEGPTVGIARTGLFFEHFPFWAAFFRSLGARVVVSGPTDDDTLEQGKSRLESEMCLPMEVLAGHYQELAEQDLDYLFVPEVVDAEPLPWARSWPRGFSCPLMQTIQGLVVNSIGVPASRVLYAQINYRPGPGAVREGLEDAARRLLGEEYHPGHLRQAVEAGYAAQRRFQDWLGEEGLAWLEKARHHPEWVPAVFLGRSYTLYDPFVAKDSLDYARQRDLAAVPQEFLLEALRLWYQGREVDWLPPAWRQEFAARVEEYLGENDNVYPIQLQKMLSTVLWSLFLDQRRRETGLPAFFFVFQDPFKCGPNAMLRHYLDSLTGYLRLTLDEHTAPAGLITRLEAFKNTCRSRADGQPRESRSGRTLRLGDRRVRRILIPEPTPHARVFAALFRNRGLEADILPRSQDSDLTLARRYVNGTECLPFIQNLQDFLDYLKGRDLNPERDGVLFFQGWACGPCRYGLYAPVQSLVLERAGFGPGGILSVRLVDTLRRLGPGFAVGTFDGMLALDLLDKMLLATRPYARDPDQAQSLYQGYLEELLRLLEQQPWRLRQVISGACLEPLEELLERAARDFAAVPRRPEERPRILVNGEFYVRLDDRCNQDLIRRIEEAGGEASLAPASELFIYTAHINLQETRTAARRRRTPGNMATAWTYERINGLIHRHEERLYRSAAALDLLHEPRARQLQEFSRAYVSEHYGGEPPMSIGRTVALAREQAADGVVFVAPFSCMPAAVVESQMGALRRDTGLPMVAVYYDGKENANREELIESLVFQARQRLARGGPRGARADAPPAGA